MQELCLEIIMSLFGTLIPFDCLTYFYDKFIEYGWQFFNALIIEFLWQVSGDIFLCQDNTDVIQFLKDLN